MPLRVLVVARWYPAHDDPGRGIFVADQVAALSAAGVEVTVASWEVAILGDPAEGRSVRGEAAARLWCDAIRERPEVAAPRSWAARGIPVTRLPAITPTGEGASRHPVDLAAHQAETLVAFGTELAERWPFELIHAHTGLPDGVAAARLADRLSLPLVMTEHDSGLARRLGDERARTAYRALFGPGRRVLAVSEVLAHRVSDLLGVPIGSVAVVPNVVDVAAFQPVDAAHRDPDELLWVGSRQASKGTDVLLEAFSRVRSTRPALRLRLIGRPVSADEEERLRALARDLQIAEVVAFEPAADRATVAAAMARAALFVHPSPLETFGVVAVEALASGLPVAATPSGGVDEILGPEGRFGEIATSTDAPALADAIARALDRRLSFDPDLLRARAAEGYAAPAVAARILEVYRALVPTSAAGARRRAGDPERPEGLGGAEPASSPAPAAPSLPLVFGLRRRSTLARISLLPPELAASIAVLSSAGRGGAGAAPDLPAGTTWTFVDADAAFREALGRLGGPLAPRSAAVRALRAARHPVRAVRLRRLARRRPDLALAAQRHALRSAVAQLGGGPIASPDGPVDVLALDADDVAVLEPLLDARVRLHAGTLRSLVDRWDASGRPAPHRLGTPAASLDAAPAAPATDAVSGGGPYVPETYWSTLHQRGDLSSVGQAALPPEINAWLYRALAGNLRRFLHRHGIDRDPPTYAFDVGTGTGYWVRFLRARGVALVDGCDLVPEAVERLRQETAALGATGTFVVADVSGPDPISPSTYPLVTCLNVLLHVVDDAAFERALQNVAGLVAPGGHLLLAEPILLNPEFERPHDPRRHSRARTLDRYRRPLEAAGLVLVAVRPATVFANNPIEASSAAALRRFQRCWSFVAHRSKAEPRTARWLGPVVLLADRLGMATGQAPTTKFALFARPAGDEGDAGHLRVDGSTTPVTQ